MTGSALLLVLSVFLFAPSLHADEKIIYPRPAENAGTPAAKSGSALSSAPLLLLALGAAAAGGWLLWRQRRTPAGLAGRDARKLAVTESRSLGNRQYLVVADYDGRKFLLGVCPGRIDLLSPLDGEKK